MNRLSPDERAWKPREIEILGLLAEGLTNREIGRRLHLAADTVRWYNRHIFERLEVHSRMQAVQRAAALGLLKPSPEEPPQLAPGFGPPEVPRSPIRYVRNGEVSIACMSIGKGPPDLLFVHGFLSHLEFAWEQPEFVRFFEALGGSARVILFDKRGVGLSDRMIGAPSIENTIDDAVAVLDSFGSKRAYVMGTSEGGAAAILLAATYPERVSGLVLYAATPKVVRGADGKPVWASSLDGFRGFIDSLLDDWGAVPELESFAPSRVKDAAFRDWWARILRGASSPASIRAVLENIGMVDIRDLLPQVRVRTLVIHKTGDRKVNIGAGRYLAAHLPDAVLLEIPGEDHIYFVDSEEIVKAALGFIREPSPRERPETRIAVVLNVSAGKDGIPPGLLQAEIEAFRPRSFTAAPRRVIAVFDSPSLAIRCSQRLRDLQKNLSLKISLHVGEVELTSGRPGKAVLAEAERAAALAAPGEILVSQPLGDILAGSDFEFVARRPLRPGPGSRYYSLG